MSKTQSKPDYGFDAPEIIKTMLLTSVVLFVISYIAEGFGMFGLIAGFILGVSGLGCLLLALSLVAYGCSGKFHIRERMLREIKWTGAEQVLDIGAGRGFLAIGAAKKLTTGKVIGIDIWRAVDLSGNSLGNAEKNIALEGVRNRVEIKTEDVRHTSFPDASFDVILSLLCLHNIDEKEGRSAACREIARVLKPGGTVVIGDYTSTDEYVLALKEAGLKIKSHTSHKREAYGLMKIIVAIKE